MKRLAWLFSIAVTTLFALLNAHSAAADSQPRLTIVNQCADPAWAVLTPGGHPYQGTALYNSGGWFQQYAKHFNWVPSAFTGTINTGSNMLTYPGTFGQGQMIQIPGASSTASALTTMIRSVSGMTLTLADAATASVSSAPILVSTLSVTPPNYSPTCYTGNIDNGSTTLTLNSCQNLTTNNFVQGQKVQIAGAGPNFTNLTTTIAQVSGQTLTLADLASEMQPNAGIFIPSMMAVSIAGTGGPGPAGMLELSIPNAGAPSGNFHFAIGCPSLKNDTEPFAGKGCVIGSSVGDLASINTLFETSFGCSNTDTTQCAFNPGTPGDCQNDPNLENCGALGKDDNYDVSVVDWYTLPLTVEVQPPTGIVKTPTQCSDFDASELDLASCPSENSTTLYSTNLAQQSLINQGIHLLVQNRLDNADYRQACIAPYKWFQPPGTLGSPPVGSNTTEPGCSTGNCTSVSYYAGAGCDDTSTEGKMLACPAHSGPQQRVGPKQNGMFSIHNTNYVRQVFALGYKGYTWQYDDGVGDQNCPSSNTVDNQTTYAKYTVTLCPSGGRPYAPAQQWEFSDGNCTPAVSSAGQRASAATYPSLLACQQSNMLYNCVDLTETDPYSVPGLCGRRLRGRPGDILGKKLQRSRKKPL